MGVESVVSAEDQFAAALRGAIADSGRSLESLRRRLAARGTPVSIATLSYWQSGRSEPQRVTSLEAVAHLEEILALPNGTLLGKLSRRRRPGPRPVDSPAAHLPVTNPVAEEALASLGFSCDQELVEVTIHDTLDLDADGIAVTRTIRSVMRAAVDGAQRAPALLVVDNPDGGTAQFRAVSGCRVGRRAMHPEDGVFAAELILDRPLERGEIAATEHQVLLPSCFSIDQSVEYFLLRKVREVVMWVRFHPDRMPSAVETYTDLGGRTTRGSLAVTPSVQQVLHQAGPGVAGISWTW